MVSTGETLVQIQSIPHGIGEWSGYSLLNLMIQKYERGVDYLGKCLAHGTGTPTFYFILICLVLLLPYFCMTLRF